MFLTLLWRGHWSGRRGALQLMNAAAGGRSLKIWSRFDLCHDAAVKLVKSGNMEGHQTGGAVCSCVLVLALQLPYISHEVRMHQGSVTEHNMRGTDVTRGGSVSPISDLKLSYTSFCSVSLTFMTLWFIIYSHFPRPNSLLCLCLLFLVLHSFFHRDTGLLFCWMVYFASRKMCLFQINTAVSSSEIIHHHTGLFNTRFKELSFRV